MNVKILKQLTASCLAILILMGMFFTPTNPKDEVNPHCDDEVVTILPI